mgnify:CR=1 FL=1
MVHQKRKDVFETPYVKLMTQYLYKMYSKKIMKMLLPSYVVHQLSIFIYLYISEIRRDLTKEELNEGIFETLEQEHESA